MHPGFISNRMERVGFGGDGKLGYFTNWEGVNNKEEGTEPWGMPRYKGGVGGGHSC